MAESVAAILSAKPTKPIDRWLGFVTLAVSIVYGFIPKTPVTTVFWLVVVFGLLLHPVWNFWWIEDSPRRRGAALTVLCGILVGIGIAYWPHTHHYFPWLPLNQIGVAGNGYNALIFINFVVRDERAQTLGGSSVSLPNNPLDNVRLSVTAPILRSDADGWHDCQLAHAEYAEWSNRDMPPNSPVVGWMDLIRETTLLHATASASNGTWDAIVVIRIINGKPETREVINGRFFSDDFALTVDESSRDFRLKNGGCH